MDNLLHGHISAHDLELYAMQRVSGDVLDSIEEHLLICESCRGSLDEIEQDLRVLRICLREAEVHSPVV